MRLNYLHARYFFFRLASWTAFQQHSDEGIAAEFVLTMLFQTHTTRNKKFPTQIPEMNKQCLIMQSEESLRFHGSFRSEKSFSALHSGILLKCRRDDLSTALFSGLNEKFRGLKTERNKCRRTSWGMKRKNEWSEENLVQVKKHIMTKAFSPLPSSNDSRFPLPHSLLTRRDFHAFNLPRSKHNFLSQKSNDGTAACWRKSTSRFLIVTLLSIQLL